MRIFLFAAFSIYLPLCVFSQNDVRAWYADGQVFVVWEVNLPIAQTCAIYASPNSFSNTSDAFLLGRPFSLEYLGYSLKENLQDTTATYRIPDGQGGLYQLRLNEGLFVFTPHQNGSLYFAVTEWGSNNVTAGQNITDTAIPFIYDPIGDPVECHLQRTFPSPFATGYACFAYVLWADGRQNLLEERSDFPIMANAAKNGMPGLFMVSAPVDLDNTTPFPLSVWLHGGGGTARQSLAGSRREVNINPSQGILVTHDDKMHGFRGLIPPNPTQPTWHFGWGKNYDPFTPNIALAPDTIINYTQRRYVWVDRWLAANFNIDTTRINIHGHSMGSAGSLGLVKAHPHHYASATLFNTGCNGPDDDFNTIFIFGTRAENFPTNLINRNNQRVRFFDLWDLYTNCSSERDIPLIRHWHGKNDDNETMKWGPIVIENFNICDSIGTGIQNHWSERPHGIDMALDLNDHWIMGIPAAQQTALDNVDFPETWLRSDESFPAFFNHRLETKNNSPGTGLIGINNGDGDNWGTWGGYHRWENATESEHTWQVTAWLESNAIFPNDNSPENFLTADLAIRRPQSFLPAAGTPVTWDIKDLATGNILHEGTTMVQADNLVVVPQVAIFKESIRKILITVQDNSSLTEATSTESPLLEIYPNPASRDIYLKTEWATARIMDFGGVEIKRLLGTTAQQAIDVSNLPKGIYWLEISTKNGLRMAGKFVKS